MVNGMNFDKSKCHILHLGWSNVGHRYKLGEDVLEKSRRKGPVGAGQQQLHMSQQCVPWWSRGY